jgi:DNA-binding GntR family transcriptional regulator
MEKSREKLAAELKRNISLSEEKISNGNVKAFVDMDAQFHEIIAKFSGSKRLLELAQTLRRHMLRYRIESIYLSDNVLRAINGHKGILEAIEKADLEEVNKAIKYHLDQVKRDVLRYAFKEMVREDSRIGE